MREILFKGKRIDNGEWIEGDYLTAGDGGVRIASEKYHPTIFCVDSDTVCQYTGLTDEIGQKIWEYDIVRHEESDTIGIVKWYKEEYVGWCVDDIFVDEQQFTDEMWNECEVIGNIFDNPELLEIS